MGVDLMMNRLTAIGKHEVTTKAESGWPLSHIMAVRASGRIPRPLVAEAASCVRWCEYIQIRRAWLTERVNKLTLARAR